MARPEWGTKRICLSCAVRFYDFHRAPVVCPACGAPFDLEGAASRLRRARPAPRVAAGGIVASVEVEEDEDHIEDAGDEAGEDEADEIASKEGVGSGEGDEAEVEEDEEDESLIEDASELGEDEDDVGEVIDGVDGEDDHR